MSKVTLDSFCVLYLRFYLKKNMQEYECNNANIFWLKMFDVILYNDYERFLITPFFQINLQVIKERNYEKLENLNTWKSGIVFIVIHLGIR